MSWPTAPLPTTAQAILLLPSGHRALDEDVAIPLPLPDTIDVAAPAGMPGLYHLVHQHHPGHVDDTLRALYVLGGRYLPHGATRVDRAHPDEVHDQ